MKFKEPKELLELHVEPDSVYKVSVSLRSGNPFHSAILMTGFTTDDDKPGAYTCIVNPSYERIVDANLHSVCINSIEKIGDLS